MTRMLFATAGAALIAAAAPPAAAQPTLTTYEARAAMAREIEALFAQMEGERSANHCIKMRASLYQIGQALPRAALAGLPQDGLRDWQRRFLAARSRACPARAERPMQRVLGVGPPGGPMALVPRPRPVMPNPAPMGGDTAPVDSNSVPLMPIPVVPPRRPMMPEPVPTPPRPVPPIEPR